MTREMGKVLAEARGDVQEGIDIAYLMAGEGRRMAGDTVPSELPDKWAMSIRQPLGVAGIITPWNFPMAIPCWKTMPALVTGNTVVFKPSSRHAALRDAPRRADGRGRLPGRGRQPRDRLRRRGRRRDRRQPGRRRSSRFTGNIGDRQAHRRRSAGRRLKRVSLELGGKNGVVVLADADLDLATDGILWSAFGTTGQRCTAASRVIVERAVVEPLLQRLEARARKLRLGSGLDPDRSTSARSSTPAPPTRSTSYIDIGRARGRARRSAAAGRRATTSPTATSSSRRSSPASAPMDRIGQEEIFGPVLSVIPVDDYGAAMLGAQPDPLRPLVEHLHPRREPGLPGDARLRDRHRLRQRRARPAPRSHLPFGGWKETGNGHREAGHAALDTYTEWKSIYVDFSGRLQRAQIDNQPG